jgi:fructose/tagatose bisphosphate aldolase
MPIATPEVFNDMLDRAKKGAFAYPAINVSSSQTVTAAIMVLPKQSLMELSNFLGAALNTHRAQL